MKDLSLSEYSATSTYIKILPELEQIKSLDIEDKLKIELSIDLIIKELISTMNSCPNIRKGISRDYIVNTRINLSKKQSIDHIIKYIKNAIEHGKNYNN